MQNRSAEFWILFISSLVIAGFAAWFGPGRLFMAMEAGCTNCIPTSESVSMCIWVAWLWTIIAIAAAFRHRFKALWLLIGAPFVLFWPFMWIKAGACDLIGRCGSAFGLIAS